MKSKELKRLRALIKRFAAISGEQTVVRDRLLWADRIFERIERSGKLDRYELFHAVRVASEALLELQTSEQSARQE